MRDAPDEVGSGLAFITAPPEEFVPEPVRGQPVIGIVCCYAGPIDEGEVAFKPLREFGPPGIDLVGPMPYVAVQQLLDARQPEGHAELLDRRLLRRTCPTRRSTSLVDRGTQPVSPLTQIIVVPGGGAIARVDEDATAFGQRNARMEHPLPVDVAGPGRHREEHRVHPRVQRRDEAVERPAARTSTSSATKASAASKPRSAPRSSQRLQALKDEWDPTNLFRINQNIPPSAGAAT